MNVHTQLTPDVIGLTKVAPFSRRGFMTASAAVAAGYTLAAGPVRADVITTSTDGLDAGDIKIKVADGEMPGYFARPERRRQSAGHSGRDGDLRPARIHQGRHAASRQARRASPSRPIIISARASISPRSPTFRSFCRSSTPSLTQSFCPISTARWPGPRRKAATPTGSASSAFAAAAARCGNMPPIRARIEGWRFLLRTSGRPGEPALAEEPDPART